MSRKVWTLLLVLFASTAGAQSLAELAKKEKERRKKVATEESDPITEQDLRRSYRGIPATTSTTSSASSTSESADGDESSDTPAEEDATAPEDPRRTEDYWRGRLRPIDERIQRLEADLNSPRYTNNPRGAWERQRLEQDLNRAKADRQALVDEARRAGAPPGWLR